MTKPEYETVYVRDRTLLECSQCGAFCIDTDKHTDWHRRMASASMGFGGLVGL